MRFYALTDENIVISFSSMLDSYANYSKLANVKRIWKENEGTGEFYEMTMGETLFSFDRYVEPTPEQIREFVWIKLRAQNV